MGRIRRSVALQRPKHSNADRLMTSSVDLPVGLNWAQLPARQLEFEMKIVEFGSRALLTLACLTFKFAVDEIFSHHSMMCSSLTSSSGVMSEVSISSLRPSLRSLLWLGCRPAFAGSVSEQCRASAASRNAFR